MSRFLDLDSIREPLGAFQLGGATYQVWPLKVAQVIKLQAHSTESTRTDHELIQLLDLLAESVPDCPRPVLESMDVPQINALMAWTQGLHGGEDAKNGQALVATTPSASVPL